LPARRAGRTDILGGVAHPSTRLLLRVAPGSRQTALAGRHGAGWKVRVAAAPERGRATDEALALVARTLDVPRSAVRLVSGGSSRDKIVEVTGLESDEVERRLERAGSSA